MRFTLRIVHLIAVVGSVTGLSGCFSPEIVQIAPDTYMISKSSAAGAFANTSALKAEAIREANEFAEKQGKVAVGISAKELRPAQGFPSFEYQFKVLDKHDPGARATDLGSTSDVVIESSETSRDLRSSEGSRQEPDLYSELMKLDDLRKRGLLTDAEFEEEKRKLLNR